MVRCTNGHENPPGQAFCGVCGVRLLPPRADELAPTGGEPLPEVVAAQRGSRRRVLVAVAIVGALVVAASAGFVLLRHPATHTIRGLAVAPECGSGYEIENANVELRNEKNELIASATTSANLVGSVTDSLCAVRFVLSDVPDAKFYSVKIGTHSGPNYRPTELAADGWKLDLSLGDAVVPTTESLCSDISTLHTALNDTDTLNAHLFQWQDELKTALGALELDAAGLELAGNDADAATLSQVLPSLRPLTRWLGYQFTVSKLNEAVNPANTSLSGVGGCSCSLITYSS